MGCCEIGDRHSATQLPNYDEKRFRASGSSPSLKSRWQVFTRVRDANDIPGLANFIRDTGRALVTIPQNSEWIPPVTIGGHAISALVELAKTHPESVSESLKNDLHVIVENLMRSPEVQDCSLVLLYYLCPSLPSPLLDRLVNIGVFEGLCGVMKLGSRLRRQTAAETARVIYENSEGRKKVFIYTDGVNALMHVLNMDRDEKDYVHNSLVRLYELLLVLPT